MKIVPNIKRNSDWPTTREVTGFIYIQENLSNLKHNTIPSTPSPLTTVHRLEDRTVDILSELGGNLEGP